MKVAQARLVWTTLAGPCTYPQKGGKVHPRAKHLPKADAEISRLDLFELIEENGKEDVVWTTDALRIFAEITNNSKEPIGRIDLQAIYRREVVARDLVMPVIPPDTSRLVEIHIPMRSQRMWYEDVQLSLGFTDSAGHRWERINTRPPQEVPKPKPRRFPRVRAWLFRRK